MTTPAATHSAGATVAGILAARYPGLTPAEAALLEVAILREPDIAVGRNCVLATVRTPPDSALYINVLIVALYSSPVASRRPDPLEGDPRNDRRPAAPGTSGQASPDLDGLLPDDPVVTVTGPWTVRSRAAATCTNCGAAPLDEDMNMTPHCASTSCWPKDDLLLCPACAKGADGDGQTPQSVLGPSHQNTVRPNRQNVRPTREEAGSDDA